MRQLKISIFLLMLFISMEGVYSGDDNPPKFSGYMFGDYYSFIAHHDSSLIGRNGFWFRRIYFTYEQDINDVFSVRLRLEMSSPGDFNIKAVPIVPYIKDAYLKYKFSKNHEMILGISESPAFKLIDNVWSYRFLEKSPLDLQKWAPSRDFGVALRGKLNNRGSLQYHLFLGNGNGYKSEINRGKKLAFSISAYPTEHFIIEAYLDWIDETGVEDWYTYQLFAAWKTKMTTIGLQGASQTRMIALQDDYHMELLSAFVTHFFTKKWGMILRVDRMFDPNPDGARLRYLPFDPNQKSTLVIAGIDFVPAKGIHITPNIEYIQYDEQTPDSNDDKDILFRLTYFYNFK